jgi:hypothetical protein
MLVANWLLGKSLLNHPWPAIQIDFYIDHMFIYFQKLLDVLHEVLPKMSLIASDFSYLPDVKIPGERAPLVSTKVYSCYIFTK